MLFTIISANTFESHKEIRLAIRLLNLLAPATILFIAVVLLIDPVSQLSAANKTSLGQLPYALALVVALLAYGFNRNQILFATLNLISAYLMIQLGLQVSLDQPNAYVLFSILSILLPINITFIATYSERGLFTPLGLTRLAGVLIGYLLLGLLWSNGALATQLPNLPTNMFEMFFAERFLSNMSAVFYGVALLTTLIYFVTQRGHGSAGVLISLVASLFMFIWFDLPNVSTLLVTAALIAMGIAVLQSSHKMAYLDELTEIPARRALQDKLATLGKRYTLAMVDIDHFKKFNDTYGHDIGDQVLRMVAAKLASVSGGGKAYRYGGEEFTLVFPGKDEAQALPFIEQLRELIANYPLYIRGDQRPEDEKRGAQMRKQKETSDHTNVTISIGVCEKTDEYLDASEVMKQADKSLYEAKNNGRNQSVAAHYKPETPKRRRTRKDYV
ncbi:GGDEF domain-containing protein [Pontibacterium sp. N1Y112]|uniref:diguanylate cyclase n=1 Tax=Pontibacterium sinense TaxID=2781979 RepID=A0A8J7K7T0_9GAMM|nr:GGDEF domain-containing protein [Pontibacterium sinense]MBE9398591.1 GGDEF domain-containing protein [Pontibacterium sinense]